MKPTDRQPGEVLIPAQDEFPGYTAPDVIVEAEGIVDRSWHNDVCAHFAVEQVHAAFPDVEISLWVERLDPADREYPGEPRFLVDVTTGGSADLSDLLGGADEAHLVHRGDSAAEALWAFVSTLVSVRAWLNDSSQWGRCHGAL